MKTTALATILSLGLASGAMATSHDTETDLETGPDAAAGADVGIETGPETATGPDATTGEDAVATGDIDLPDIPSEDEATLADCRIWVSTLGEMVERGEGDEDALAEAEDVQDEAMQACDDGNYYDGIVMAAEAIERIDADADAADALDDDDHDVDAAEEDEDEET